MDRALSTDLLNNLLIINDWDIPANYFKYLEYLPVAGIAFLFGLLLIPIVGQIAKRFDFMDWGPKDRRERDDIANKHDNPDRHLEKESKPKLGGLPIVLGVIIGTILLLNLGIEYLPLLIGLLIIVGLGIIDDRFNLPGVTQLVFQVLAATIVAFSIFNLEFISNPFGGIVNLNWSSFVIGGAVPLEFVFPGDLILIGWIILATNAVKWVGGSDALVESNSLIAYLLMAVLGIRTQDMFVTITSFLFAGGLLSSIFFNFPPARIVSGAVGKTSYGFVLAVLSIMNQSKVAATLLILAVPILDAFFTIGKRIVKYKPKSLKALLRYNDKSHLHHQLMDMGLSEVQLLLVEVSISLLIGSLAILTTGAMRLFAIIIGAALVVGTITLFHVLANRKKENGNSGKKKESPESKYSY